MKVDVNDGLFIAAIVMIGTGVIVKYGWELGMVTLGGIVLAISFWRSK